MDFTKQWQALLTTMERPPQLCDKPDKLHNGPDEYDIFNANATEIFRPTPKPNHFAKQQGYGPSAYLFDFLDDVFQKTVVEEFTKAFDAAKALIPDPKAEDPYSVDKLLYFYSQGAFGSLNATGSGGNVDALSKYNKNFNPAFWTNSITVPQMDKILNDWGWRRPIMTSTPAKKLLDNFDFDGDGRLNPSEFIILSIVNNVHYLGQEGCKEHCYKDILLNLIDPLFDYLDCDRDGFIGSENMWVGLRNLKRTDAEKFSMYKCRMPNNILTKDYRTTSVNDFILKNFNKADGYVTLDEFRAGILLGYWDRHTDNTKVIQDESKTLKSIRWQEGGTKDVVCDKMLALIPPPTPLPLVQSTPI